MSRPARQGVAAVLASASQLGAARLLNFSVRAVYLALLARLLGPELYGLLAYGHSWYNAFVPITALGLGASLSLRIADDRGDAAQAIADVLLASMTANAVWAGLLVARLGRGPAALGTGFLSGPALAAPLLAVLGYELTRGLWLQPLAGMLAAGCLLGWTLFAVADARRQSQPGSVTDGLDDPGDSPPATPGDGARSRSYPSCN